MFTSFSTYFFCESVFGAKGKQKRRWKSRPKSMKGKREKRERKSEFHAFEAVELDDVVSTGRLCV